MTKVSYRVTGDNWIEATVSDGDVFFLSREVLLGLLSMLDEHEGRTEIRDDFERRCWYCQRKDGEMVFSMEFDTHVHLDCLAKKLRAKPDDEEAQIMAKELGVSTSEGK